jgi:hypothetical protein
MVFPIDSNDNPMTTTASYVLGVPNVNYNAAFLNAYTTILPSASNFGNRISIACDSINDRLFVSDGSNNRVMVFNVASGTLSHNPRPPGALNAGFASFVRYVI